MFQYKVEREIIQSLSTFYSFPVTRILVVKDNKIFKEDIIRISQSLNEGVKADINGIKYSDWYEENIEHPELMVISSPDIIQVSFLNQIPLSRLCYDYENVFELNSEYLDKLRSIMSVIQPCVDYLVSKELIFKTETSHISYHGKIREFLKNELK